MAFNRSFAPSNTNAAQQQGGFTKAGGFINLYLTRADGSKAKVGAIALRADEEVGAFLLQAFEDPENIKKFANKLEFEYRRVTDPAERPQIVL